MAACITDCLVLNRSLGAATSAHVAPESGTSSPRHPMFATEKSPEVPQTNSMRVSADKLEISQLDPKTFGKVACIQGRGTVPSHNPSRLHLICQTTMTSAQDPVRRRSICVPKLLPCIQHYHNGRGINRMKKLNAKCINDKFNEAG